MLDELFLKMKRLRETEIPPVQADELSPYLVVGLGNPGREYRENRHNIGFMAVDTLSKMLGIGPNKVQSRALVGVGTYAGKRVVLVKPQTFMNLSGQAVGALLRFYKVPLDHMIVIHDDLDLPLGTLRIRPGGGSAGQKGMASIIEQLGTQEFPRLRLGIGRPPGRMEAADYVLQDFPAAERDVLNRVLDQAAKAAQVFMTAGLEPAMNEYNGVIA